MRKDRKFGLDGCITKAVMEEKGGTGTSGSQGLGVLTLRFLSREGLSD